MDIRGKKLVVVGGAGLIGSHTVDALVSTDVGEVVVFDNFVRGEEDNLREALRDDRVRVVEGNILDLESLNEVLRGANGVFHFAALWLLQCHEDPRAGFDVNVQGTFNVLEACIDQSVERLVFSSSASVYGDAVEEPMTEEHPFNNTTFYGATKIAGETMASALHHRDGLPYVGLRYMNVYGPRQDYRGAYIAVIMKMLDAVDRGEPIKVFGDGTQAYDFVYVGDCAQANLRAMEADTADHFYNVATGVRTSIAELADLIVQMTGTDQPVEFEPAGLTFVKNRIGSPDKARDEIGFTAAVSLEDGLRALINWRSAHIAEVERSRASAR